MLNLHTNPEHTKKNKMVNICGSVQIGSKIAVPSRKYFTEDMVDASLMKITELA